eukprot:TRINITY_DN347_c0_g1_i4.p1 TRINITY_DN347_c0_g1~~TRINITY_DN347_c0_g1_i4.p1  ORF type:complete len:838 (-),score=267.99 TRINITY_DN347_c0_g1_i4:252-2765(-)
MSHLRPDLKSSYSPNQKTSSMVALTKDLMPGNNHFRVMVRVRPPLPRELEKETFVSTIQVTPDQKSIIIYEYFNIDLYEPERIPELLNNSNMYTTHQFSFDYVYDQNSPQQEVYENAGKPAVGSILQGYNATIFAYGQTGTGKTHTMEGFKYNSHDPQRGIIPRAMEDIFQYIENFSNERARFMVRASYLQIYNEVISDLLRTDRTNLLIREDKRRGVFVEGLSEWAVRTPNEIYSLMKKGAASRATASTKMNDVSSRSHAVFIIIVEQMVPVEGDGDDPDAPNSIKVGKLNLVDLAGSERVRVTGATGKRLEECKKINQSLSCLGNVIAALTDPRAAKSHIPYRDSKITRLLEDSLGGNCFTTMMAMVSPALEGFSESLSSLKFANRAKNIKNTPIVNEDVDQRTLLRKYENEIRKLKLELDERTKTLFDKSKVLQLEEDKRKAEQDRVAAMAALEARSREFFQEREDKRRLEDKIRTMYSQMLIGGRKIEESPAFQSALEEQQRLIREQYEKKLQDLERERYQIEEDKAQVDRYKQLLLKQRDIMIALTSRLNERDETIIQLQEELDAYDRIHRETEEMLELQTNRIRQLESILRENGLQVPKETTPDQYRGHAGGQAPENIGEVVTADGQETFNITKNNLLSSEEQVQHLSKIANDQKLEIVRLKQELLASRRENEDDERRGAVGDLQAGHIQEMQGYYEGEIDALGDRLRNAEDEQRQMAATIARLEGENKMLREEGTRKSYAPNRIHSDLKQTVDSVILCLSHQNDPQKLQNVAKDLLAIQRMVSQLCNGTGAQENTSFSSSKNYSYIMQEHSANENAGIAHPSLKNYFDGL